MSYTYFQSLSPEEQDIYVNGPLLPPPPGVVSNLVDPPNQNTLAQASCVVCLTLATIVLLLRAYSRIFVVRVIFIEDGLALCGYILFVAFNYWVYRLVADYGIFVHEWDTPVKNLAGVLYILHVGATIYCGAIMSLKVACLVEWARIFAPQGGRFKLICYIVVWINVLFYTSTIFASIFACRPISAKWDKLIPGSCINTMALDTISSIFNIVSDFAILLLPQKIIWRLQMTRKRKIGVSLVFAVGLLALSSACSRFGMTVKYVATSDTLYAIASVALWCLAEMTCMILVFCIPAIPKAFSEDHILGRVVTSLRSWTRFTRVKSISKEGPRLAGSESEMDTFQDLGGNAYQRGVLLRQLHAQRAQGTDSTERLQPEQGHSR
ncbi:hypothetical protein F4821DRAFT_230826 [Hypoxylon rubiginosum]|uniref:Uncharacterized protein n=1 Tax=Hypoxylon rubiginosum TaxID=110542 RepID=A0ACC0DAS8_9PEZI|nr:hypothetical protein F4821DRAFT_230826 [Hypoxylon rubiginosum]